MGNKPSTMVGSYFDRLETRASYGTKQGYEGYATSFVKIGAAYHHRFSALRLKSLSAFIR